MMKIAPVFYNEAGELMAPLAHDVRMTSSFPGAEATVDAGFYHRVKLEAPSAAELKRKLSGFRRGVASLKGFKAIETREYTVQLGGYSAVGVEVLYAVEEASKLASARAARPPARRASVVLSRR